MIDHGKDDPIPYPPLSDGEQALCAAMMEAIRDQVLQLNEREKNVRDDHSCSYYCDRPECIKAQRDELVRKYVETKEKAEPVAKHGEIDREFLGKLVRMEWVAWAREQSDTKPSWLTGWSDLTEPEREVDRRIGERIYRMAIDVMYAPTAERVKVPDGWKLVPVEPTRGMLDDANNYDSDMIGSYALEFWQTMLNAAPKPEMEK